MSSSTSKSLNMNSVNHGRLSQRFDLIRKLGQGTYGKVQLGINKTTGVEVALKTIKKSKIENNADLLRIKREISIMTCCNHPNIIHIYEVYENKEKIILVMEYAPGGELYDYLNDKKKLDEPEAKRIFSQISSAIYYCHKHKIVHRDLKLENILLDENNNAKIADFGLSNVYGEQLLKTFCGSPLYASPEIVRGIPYHGPEVDCWSLGVLLYTLVYGSMPFDGTHFKKLVKQITSGTFYEPNFESGASDIIKALLTVDSKRRLNIHQVVSHPWLQSTDCQTISEEFCNKAPVRAEFLDGINKSDTLDEVSEISSTSIEDSDDSKEKTKIKPTRKTKVSNESNEEEDTNKIQTIPQKPERKELKAENETKTKTEQNEKKNTSIAKIEPKGSPKISEVSNVQKEQPSKVNEKSKIEKTKKDPIVSEVSKIGKSKTEPPKVIEATKVDKIEKGSPKLEKTEEGAKTDEKVIKPVAEVQAQVKELLKLKTQPQKPNEPIVESLKSKVVALKPKTEPLKRKSPLKETQAEQNIKVPADISKHIKNTPSLLAPDAGKKSIGAESDSASTVPVELNREQRSTSTPTSEEPSSPTLVTPGVTRIERRNCKLVSQKPAEFIQNLKDTNKDGSLTTAIPSKLNDIKKRFENGQPSNKEESGIGVILKRRKSIIDSVETEGAQNHQIESTGITPHHLQLMPNRITDIQIPPPPKVKTHQPITVTSKPPITTGSRTHHLVIEQDVAPLSQEILYDTSSRPSLKLVMPKTTKPITQPPIMSASPPITKQGAAKKIGSLITKVKSNEISNSSASTSRERIIPIQFDDSELSTHPVSRSGTSGSSDSTSRTGSISVSNVSGEGPPSRADSRSFASVGSPASASTISSPSYSRHNSIGNGMHPVSGGGTCQIMKSKREFIIPITIEDRNEGDFTTDLRSSKNSSAATSNSSAGSSSSRVYNSRRHTSNLSLISPDSTDLEDDFFDDDDFLSSDALFSSLLQRVRGLRLGERLKENTKQGRQDGRWTALEFKRK